MAIKATQISVKLPILTLDPENPEQCPAPQPYVARNKAREFFFKLAK